MSKTRALLKPRDSSCTGSGALYVLPASGSTIDSAQKTSFQWNPSCLENADGNIDIYLYAPLQPTANLPIHAWTQIPAKQGKFDVKLAPKWWNATQSVELSLNIVPSGNQPWDSANPFGPNWFASYTAPTDGSKPPADAVVDSTSDNKLVSVFYKGGHLTTGGKAAAIVCPLLVLFILLGILIRKLHINRNNKTADWADQMDKRMSQISLDWTTGGDGRAGPIPGSRPASFINRPQSSYRPSLEAVRAAYNANVSGSAAADGTGEMSEMGDHSVAGSAAARQSNYRSSRVSFAPSTDVDMSHSFRSHARNVSMPRVGTNSVTHSRAHRDSQQSTSLPRINSRFQNAIGADDIDNDDEFLMSPVQEAGATPVNFNDLRKSMDDEFRNSVMAYPALTMMDNDDQQVDGQTPDAEHVENEASEQIPQSQDDISSHSETAPAANLQTGMLPPTNATSPDEALKQYAAMRAAGTSSSASNQMRTLYSSAPTKRGSSIYVDAPVGRTTALSMEAGSSINDDEIVGYNQMINEHGRLD